MVFWLIYLATCSDPTNVKTAVARDVSLGLSYIVRTEMQHAQYKKAINVSWAPQLS